MPDCCRRWRACRYLSGMHDCHLLITWHCSTTCHLGSHCSWALALLAAFTHDECWMHARWLGHLGKLRSLNASSLSKELCHRYIANLGGTQASTSWMVNLSCLQFVQKVSRCARFTFFVPVTCLHDLRWWHVIEVIYSAFRPFCLRWSVYWLLLAWCVSSVRSCSCTFLSVWRDKLAESGHLSLYYLMLCALLSCTCMVIKLFLIDAVVWNSHRAGILSNLHLISSFTLQVPSNSC